MSCYDCSGKCDSAGKHKAHASEEKLRWYVAVLDAEKLVADLDAGDRTAPERAADEGERSYAPCARERVARGVGVNIARAGVECG